MVKKVSTPKDAMRGNEGYRQHIGRDGKLQRLHPLCLGLCALNR